MEQAAGMRQPGIDQPEYDYKDDIKQQVLRDASMIDAWTDSKNIAEDLKDEDLDKIGQRVVADFLLDLQSMEPWREEVGKWTELATMMASKKSFPFDNASNAKYPLLAMAAVQFSARTYPIIVQNANVAKSRVIGEDPTGEKALVGRCIDTHMNYQLLEEMEEWEEDMDTMLTVMPIVGCGIKKTYYGGAALKRNVSAFVSPMNIVLPYYSESFNSARRVTEIIEITENEHIEHVREGLFIDIGELGRAVNLIDNDDDQDNGMDVDAPHKYLEQHRLLDLDGDGYQEPYVVTVHFGTSKVVRITARWDVDGIVRDDRDEIVKIIPNRYYTQYIFMPSPDGGVMGMGFGKLLGPINDVIDSTVNQLLDAGTRNNTGGGFIGNDAHPNKGHGGVMSFQPGEYKPIDYSGDDIRKALVPLQFPEPSGVLFNLLGLMIQSGKELSSVTEALTGAESPTNEPATTRLSRVEQGLKVFSAIQKRVYRALKKELKKLYRLNRLYLDEEIVYRVNDIEEKIERRFYEDDSLDIVPVADPNEVSDTQKRFKAEALMAMRGQGLNDQEINKRFLEALGIVEPEKILQSPEPAPDPKIILEMEKLKLEKEKHNLDLMKFGYQMVEIQSRTIKNLAEAEAKEIGPQLDKYKADMQNLTSLMQVRNAGQPNNTGSQ